jgi:hypothetical protein
MSDNYKTISVKSETYKELRLLSVEREIPMTRLIDEAVKLLKEKKRPIGLGAYIPARTEALALFYRQRVTGHVEPVK